MVIESHRQLGDVLHSTIVVRHIRASRPDVGVVWAICERYLDAFAHFGPTELGPHAIAALPNLPPFPADGSYRIAWVQRARTLPGVIRAFGCGVHPWGWKAGTIVDAVMINADIAELKVPRRPCMPLEVSDIAWAQSFEQRHGLSRYLTLEYTSYTLAVCSLDWYARFVAAVGMPVVALAGGEFPLIPGAIDGRATSFRQAKALISRSACFVGCGSGLSVTAAALGCEQPVLELTAPELSMPSIGYRRSGDRHKCMQGASPDDVALAVRALVGAPRIEPMVSADAPVRQRIGPGLRHRTRLGRG